jgi:hypothetical protein
MQQIVKIDRDRENIVSLIAETPLVREALAQKAAAQTLARKGILAALKALERDHFRVLPQLEAAAEAAMEKLRQARQMLAIAEKEAAAAIGAKATAGYAFTARHDQLTAQLRDGAEPRIAQWIGEMLTELETTRKRFQYSEIYPTLNQVTGIKKRVVVNNAESVAKRARAIMDAIEAAEALKLEADQTVVPARLGALAAALPVVEFRLEEPK